MKWLRTMVVIAVCGVLMGQMLVKAEPISSGPISPVKQVSNKILEEYQRIQESNSSIRTFSYEDGAPQKIYSTLRDNYGYLWTRNYFSDNQIHRFNGTSFTDIQKEEPLIKNDSLVANIIQTNDKSIYMATNHYLLRWNGYQFIRYAFPKDDRIAQAMTLGSKVLCIGAKGYAVLDSGEWRYVRIPIDIKLHRDRYTIYASKGSTFSMPHNQSTTDRYHNLLNVNYLEFISTSEDGSISFNNPANRWTEDLTLQIYSNQGKKQIRILSKDEINSLAERGISILPEFTENLNGDLYLYLENTNLMFRIDAKNKRLVANYYPVGSKILAHHSDKHHNLFICYTQNKQIFLQEVESGINHSSTQYYLPSEEYDENTSYHILLDDTVMQFGGSSSDNPSKLFKLSYGYPELNKCDFPEANLRGSYATYGFDDYPGIDFFDHYACVNIPRKELPGVHRLYLLDLQTGLKEHIDIADPAKDLDILDFDPLSRTVLVMGKDQVLALSIRRVTTKIYSFSDSYGSVALGKTMNNIVFFDYRYNREDSSAKYGLVIQQNGVIKSIYSNPDGTIEGYNTDKAYFSDRYSKNRKNPRKIVEVDLTTGSTMEILAKQDKYKLIPMDNRTAILYDDLSFDRYAPSGLQRGSLQAVTDALQPTLKEAGLEIQDIFSIIDPVMLGKSTMFFSSGSREIEKDAGGNNSLVDFINFSTNPEAILPPGKLEYVPGEKPELRMPAFTYSLQGGLTWQPRWIESYRFPMQEGDQGLSKFWDASNNEYQFLHSSTDRGRRLIKHWEGTKSKGRIRYSWFENGKLNLSASDFSVPIVNGSFPEIAVRGDKQGIYFELNDHLYWLERVQKGDVYRGIDLGDYKSYGNLQDVDRFGKDIWLTLEKALLRHNTESGQSFVFGSKDGIPSDLSALYQEQGKFYLLSNSGVYHFTPEEVGATLMIPWLQANGSRFSSSLMHRFKHTQNNLIFPVDILNTLFPERMKLSYYLKGYDKDWKHRDYASQIEYPQLPPGKYEFQIYGTSPTGRQSSTLKIPFRIKHPFYANGWAYLIYIIALYWIGRHLYRLRIKQLQQRNLALEKVVSDRTQELRDRQQRLDESIDYASLIQKSILPQPADMAAAFKEHFVIWKPRDILGGDFYWLHETEEGSTFLAVIDCTGHGVPAALLTMTVNSLLNNLIRDKRQEQLGQILETMHEEIGKALHQEQQHTQQDGFEISLIKWNKVQQSLCFAGAGLNLLYRRPEDTELQQLRGEKHGIGGLKWHKERIYTEQTINDAQALCIYLYTDGILDQLDDKDGKLVRFGHQGWISLLDSLTSYSLKEQQRIIEDRLKGMLHLSEQRDDISILGIRLS